MELLKVSIKAHPPSILVYRSRSPKDMANIDAATMYDDKTSWLRVLVASSCYRSTGEQWSTSFSCLVNNFALAPVRNAADNCCNFYRILPMDIAKETRSGLRALVVNVFPFFPCEADRLF